MDDTGATGRAGARTTRRVDAMANRNRILDVARRALAADPDASLNSIAKAAEVGAGTLYRHFPCREALLVGVYLREIEVLVGLAPMLLTKHPPMVAFQSWCDRFVQSGEVKRGLAESLHAAVTEQDLVKTYGRLVDAVRQLLQACEASGSMLAHAEPEDVLTLLSPLLRVPPTAAGKARIRRVLVLIFRGLGAKADVLASPGARASR